MRVLVSRTIKKMQGYLVSNKLSGLSWMAVDTLIFHSCDDDEVTFVSALSALPATVKTLVYINNELDPLYYSIFSGRDAYIYNDEVFLTDKDTLDYFVQNLGNLGCECQRASAELGVLETFVNQLTSAAPREVMHNLTNKNYMATIVSAMQTMSNTLVLAEDSAPKVVELTDRLNRHIEVLEEQVKRTSDEIESLRNMTKTLNAKQVGQNILQGQSAMKFGTYNINPTIKNVVYIRCFGDVPYLTTFLIAFQGWLAATRNGKATSSKILIARPGFANYMQRYAEVPKITAQSAGLFDINRHNVCVTFEPNKKVMDVFFKAETNIFFVLDFMQSDTPLVAGHMVKTFNGYSSPKIYRSMVRDAARAPLTRSFFSRDGAGDTAFIIPYIEGFCDKGDAERKSAYFKACKDMYTRFYDIIAKPAE